MEPFSERTVELFEVPGLRIKRIHNKGYPFMFEHFVYEVQATKQDLIANGIVQAHWFPPGRFRSSFMENPPTPSGGWSLRARGGLWTVQLRGDQTDGHAKCDRLIRDHQHSAFRAARDDQRFQAFLIKAFQ